jgi:hypothetical protein
MRKGWFLIVPLILLVGGCELTEIRSKWKTGPEFRHAKGEDATRWTAQTGLEAKFSNGHALGVTYRRRDTTDLPGFSQYDNGVWLEYSFPLWKKPKKDDKKEIEQLKRRIEALEQEKNREENDS